jgi:hypothetical protein
MRRRKKRPSRSMGSVPAGGKAREEDLLHPVDDREDDVLLRGEVAEEGGVGDVAPSRLGRLARGPVHECEYK